MVILSDPEGPVPTLSMATFPESSGTGTGSESFRTAQLLVAKMVTVVVKDPWVASTLVAVKLVRAETVGLPGIVTTRQLVQVPTYLSTGSEGVSEEPPPPPPQAATSTAALAAEDNQASRLMMNPRLKL